MQSAFLELVRQRSSKWLSAVETSLKATHRIIDWQPIELIWPHLRANYPRRYDESSIVSFLDSFFRDAPGSDLIAEVGRKNRISARMDEPQEALIIDDDMAAPLIGKSRAQRAGI